ncbi:MAG TPA: tetratricopeptide repeat protein, partial [Pyrinomonadaceae bacterium]|nr:tetratricopeptide repeat protein [Pyrinomonadaceae bacterium]
AESRLIIGSFNLAAKDFTGAINELNEATKLNPRLLTVHSQLGNAYLSTGHREQAIKEYKAELALNPLDFNANMRLGWLYRDDGNLDEAAALLKKALELRPDDVGALFQLAQLAQARGTIDESVSLLERVVALAPDFTAAHVLLARQYYKLKRPQDAERTRAIIERLNAEQQKKQPTAETQNAPPPSLAPAASDPENRHAKSATPNH